MAQVGTAVRGRGVGEVVETESGTWALSRAAVVLLFFNLLDALFTLTFLQIGVAQEANPIMRAAYEASPLSFMALKLGVVNVGVVVLATYKTSRLAQLALRAAVGVYAVIVTWHLAFLTHVVFP